MVILIVAIAIALVSVPLAVVLLVSFAVFREETRHSLAGLAPGALERSARRLLAVHAAGSCHPIDRDQVRDAFDFPAELGFDFDPVSPYQPAASLEPVGPASRPPGDRAALPREPVVSRS